MLYRCIYRVGRRSIVWLYSINWRPDLSLKAIFRLPRPDEITLDLETIWEYIKNTETLVRSAQDEERWLLSGRALQESVLLSSTGLIDGNGTTFLAKRMTFRNFSFFRYRGLGWEMARKGKAVFWVWTGNLLRPAVARLKGHLAVLSMFGGRYQRP